MRSNYICVSHDICAMESEREKVREQKCHCVWVWVCVYGLWSGTWFSKYVRAKARELFRVLCAGAAAADSGSPLNGFSNNSFNVHACVYVCACMCVLLRYSPRDNFIIDNDSNNQFQRQRQRQQRQRRRRQQRWRPCTNSIRNGFTKFESLITHHFFRVLLFYSDEFVGRLVVWMLLTRTIYSVISVSSANLRFYCHWILVKRTPIFSASNFHRHQKLIVCCSNYPCVIRRK